MTNLEIAKDQLELALNEIKNTLTVEQGELIHDYVNEALKQVKNCSIPDVVGQSELLLSFHKAIIPEDVVYNSGYTREEIVGAFLKRQ